MGGGLSIVRVVWGEQMIEGWIIWLRNFLPHFDSCEASTNAGTVLVRERASTDTRLVRDGAGTGQKASISAREYLGSISTRYEQVV